MEMGRYAIVHPLVPFLKPRLILVRDPVNGKIRGTLRWMGRQKKLKLIHQKETSLIFLLSASIISFELVIEISPEQAPTGFIDTPIGHYCFKLKKITGRRTSLSDTKTTYGQNVIPVGYVKQVNPADSHDVPVIPNTGPHLDLRYMEADKAFSCRLFGKNILGTRLTARIGKHEAVPVSVISHPFQDVFGTCLQWEIQYVSPVNPDRTVTAHIRIHDGFLVFDTINHYPVNGKEDKHLFGYPYIGFPCFEGEDWTSGLSMLTFKRQAPFNHPEQWHGRMTDSLREGRNQPLMASTEQYETVVLSPLSHLLHGTVSIRHQPKTVSCGLPRAVKSIPEETCCEVLMVYGSGINATLERWGGLLAQRYDVIPVPLDADIQLTHLSYWTNAGSAYWYNTFHNRSYEETLEMLKTHHQRIGLQFGSYQLDSWWYKREHEGYTGGIMEWEPRAEAIRTNYNSLMPFRRRHKPLPLFTEDRLSRVQALLDTPIGCHFKQLSSSSVYVKQDPSAFLSGEFALPTDEASATSLFKSIFTHPRWRLSFVVHDWLQWMGDRHPGFLDLETGPAYFRALDRALQDIPAPDNRCGHLTLQLCMTQPHMTLNAVSMQSVTTIRSTSDSNSFFVEGPKRWWWHLYSSRFIEVLGKYAFYDNRLSGRKHWHLFAARSRMEMIWLGLSCGPIGLGDPIGKENLALIRPTVMSDGTIIKPDSPAKPLDRCFLIQPNHRENREGVTVVAGNMIPSLDSLGGYSLLYLLSINMHPCGKPVHASFSLKEAEPFAGNGHASCHSASVSVTGRAYALYQPESGIMSRVEVNHDLRISLAGKAYIYHLAAPILNGIAFLGDISKHVSGGTHLIHTLFREPGHWTIHGNLAGNAPPRWVFYCEWRIRSAMMNGVSLFCLQKGPRVILEMGSCREKRLKPGNEAYSLDILFDESS